MIRIQTTYICSYGNKPVLTIQGKQQQAHQLTWKIWEGILMHGLMPDCENCAGSFPYSCDFACITARCAGGGSLLFPSSQGFLLSYPGPWWALWLRWMGSLTQPATPGRPLPPELGLTSWKSLSPASCLLLLLADASSGRPRTDRERTGDDYINQCQVWELWFMNMHNELSPLRRTS